ncbi:Na(+)-translocating NADH-quinone reductase subunit A [Flexithrix dorotheae]|uniref:Na(+)-translocating NADH-quinone reductase subunit A n=1 Tax=Flexithrix dorotheae TaxID=70993 RepID=UPI0003731439|nr:Na(+)-translocating NADH-quinone reductase subunit A [Flexithrix dorotheae]
MSQTIKLKKGFNINLAGKAEKKIGQVETPETFAIKPSDFPGMIRPKVTVKVGDKVNAGDTIMFDKKLDAVLYTAPVSGEVIEINRGEKRKLINIKILADKEISYKEFKKHTVSEISTLSREEAQQQLLESGVWPNLVQRPYAVVANPEDTPKAIFISAFDSNPLAPSYDFLLKDQDKYFQAGVDVLKKFTKGSIHVNIDGNAEVSQLFTHTKNVQINKFLGKHPYGNVGVQIHHLDPINKGDIVWTSNPYGVVQIGKLFLEGKYDASKVIAVAGSEIKNPQYYSTYMGACVDKFLHNNITGENVRVISGNVLTGAKIEQNGYLGFYDHLVTVIPEGNRSRFVLTEGWLAPTFNRLSFHRAFNLFSFLNPPTKEYVLDTSTNGEDRPFVVSGAFEKVLPMDIYPTYLLKAIMAEDYDEMEALGIYEIAEEDLAICEFIDVSKHDIQDLVRTGLNLMREG